MEKLFGLFMMGILIIINNVSAQENKNVFTCKIGDFEICLLSEGQQNGKVDILIGATPEILRKYVPEGSFPNAVNAFLVRTQGKTVLIDAGFGRNLFDNMKSLGVSPEQIDVVLITHMHGDHIGGMLREGKVAFPNAEICLPQPEYDYWTGDKVADVRAQGARNVIAAYRQKLHLFQPDELGINGKALFPGFRGIAAYGHTPGHTMYMVESGDEKILIWGDLAHAMAVQMPRPQVAVTYDVNPGQAIVSRKKTLEYVSKHNIPVAGMHIAFPAVGKVTADSKDSYRFTPLK